MEGHQQEKVYSKNYIVTDVAHSRAAFTPLFTEALQCIVYFFGSF